MSYKDYINEGVMAKIKTLGYKNPQLVQDIQDVAKYLVKQHGAKITTKSFGPISIIELTMSNKGPKIIDKEEKDSILETIFLEVRKSSDEFDMNIHTDKTGRSPITWEFKNAADAIKQLKKGI